MSVKLNSSGGGSVTLQEPTTASNFTLTLPAQTANVITDSSGVLNIGSNQIYKDASGNVGIGTSSPGYKVDVSTASATNGLGINLTNSGSTGAGINFLQSGVDSFFLSMPAGTGGLRFVASGTNERARIDASGNFLVGTTSVSNGALLTVAGTVSASLNGRIYSLGTYNNTTGNAANMHVAADGHFFRSTSSLKYKTDVKTATHGLAELMGLRPVTYKGTNDGDTIFGGLIAEEVHAAGLTEFVQYAEDGSPDALAYGNMVSLCIKAIQELKAELDAAKAEIEILKGPK